MFNCAKRFEFIISPLPVYHMSFQNWSIHRCGTLWTIQIISLIQMNTFHFEIILIFFEGNKKIRLELAGFFSFFQFSQLASTTIGNSKDQI